MKTMLRFLLILGVCYTYSSSAQQAVEIDTDSLYFYSSNCPTPVSGSMSIQGAADNYNSSSDSIRLEIWWGDGTVTFDTIQLYESGVTDYFFTTQYHTYAFAGTFYPMIIATAPNGIADTAFSSDSVLITTNCVQISGYLYKDLNSNCQLEASDDTIPGYVKVEDASGNLVGMSFTNPTTQNYSMTLPTGLTNLSLYGVPWTGYVPTCPQGGSYTINSNSNQTFDIGLECIVNGFDLFHFQNAFVAPPGDTGLIWTRSSAYHCDVSISIVDTLYVVLDPLVDYVGMHSGPAPSAMNGDTLFWYYTMTTYVYQNLYAISRSPFLRIKIETDTTLSLGDSVCLYSQSAFSNQDTNHNNNFRDWCPEVGVSYDPNNKLVFEQGKGPNGNIDTSTTELTYIVNFQNTGTAPAQHVYIIDSISDKFDLSSFKIESFSHPVEFKYLKNRKIRFDFHDINLIDSVTNEEESKGYIAFTLKLKENLPVGTQIENTAGIYFDYNAPIITNTTLNTLYIAPDEPEDPDSLVIALSGRNVTCLDWDNGRASVSIASGNPPYTFLWSNGSTAGTVSDLASGTFTITVTDNEGLVASESITLIEDRQYPSPVVGSVTGSMSVQAWESYIYTMTNVTGNTFEWSALGGNVLDAANNQAEILWNAGPVGTIQVTQVSEHGCKAQRETEVQIQFVGADELMVDQVQIYPNPSSDHVFIDDLPEGSVVAVSIYDLTGRIIFTKRVSSKRSKLDVSALSSGTYLVQLAKDGQVICTTTMVKE